MTHLGNILTLAMLKMEKNFVAHLTKCYPREPYNAFDEAFLLERIKQEVKELELALDSPEPHFAMEECADVSNFVDFLFERLSERLRQRDVKTARIVAEGAKILEEYDQ